MLHCLTSSNKVQKPTAAAPKTEQAINSMRAMAWFLVCFSVQTVCSW